VFCKLRFGRRINGIAFAAPNFFGACGAGSNADLARKSVSFKHISQYKFRHRTAADVAVADEHNFHCTLSFAIISISAFRVVVNRELTKKILLCFAFLNILLLDFIYNCMLYLID
jgi:hypothetical protein